VVVVGLSGVRSGQCGRVQATEWGLFMREGGRQSKTDDAGVGRIPGLQGWTLLNVNLCVEQCPTLPRPRGGSSYPCLVVLAEIATPARAGLLGMVTLCWQLPLPNPQRKKQ